MTTGNLIGEQFELAGPCEGGCECVVFGVEINIDRTEVKAGAEGWTVGGEEVPRPKGQARHADEEADQNRDAKAALSHE